VWNLHSIVTIYGVNKISSFFSFLNLDPFWRSSFFRSCIYARLIWENLVRSKADWIFVLCDWHLYQILFFFRHRKNSMNRALSWIFNIFQCLCLLHNYGRTIKYFFQERLKKAIVKFVAIIFKQTIDAHFLWVNKIINYEV